MQKMIKENYDRIQAEAKQIVTDELQTYQKRSEVTAFGEIRGIIRKLLKTKRYLCH